MSFVLRRAAFTIAGAGRNTVAEVIDAHLETLSMVVLTTIWATIYAWFEGTAEDVGKWFHFFNLPWPASLLGTFSTYHIMFGFTVFAISFSFGFLKFTRMLWFRKRYLMFTALGNYPYAIALEDFLYFFFSAPYARLTHTAWTCSVLSLGCWTLKLPWSQTAPINITNLPNGYNQAYYLPIVIPRWYFVAFAISAVMFFLAYRSALVNLLVTKQVMKQAGFLEKTRLLQSPGAEIPHVVQEPAHIVEHVQEPTLAPAPPSKREEAMPESKPEQQATRIVDADREELVRRLRERLERGG